MTWIPIIWYSKRTIEAPDPEADARARQVLAEIERVAIDSRVEGPFDDVIQRDGVGRRKYRDAVQRARIELSSVPLIMAQRCRIDFELAVLFVTRDRVLVTTRSGGIGFDASMEELSEVGLHLFGGLMLGTGERSVTLGGLTLQPQVVAAVLHREKKAFEKQQRAEAAEESVRRALVATKKLWWKLRRRLDPR